MFGTQAVSLTREGALSTKCCGALVVQEGLCVHVAHTTFTFDSVGSA